MSDQAPTLAPRIHFDIREVAAPVVETVPLTPGTPSARAYPHLQIRQTHARRTLSVPVVVIENPFLTLTVAPSLGGRVVAILDKRTNRDILPRWDDITLAEAGPRGLLWNHGLEFLAGARHRMDDMGTLEHRPYDPEDEESPAGILMAGVAGPTSFHLGVTLPADRAEIVLDLKLHNRTLRRAPGQSGLRLHLPGKPRFLSNGIGAIAYDEKRDAGLALFWEPGTFEEAHPRSGSLELFARPEDPARSLLAARRTDEWKVRAIPLSGLGKPQMASLLAAVGTTEGRVRVQTTQPIPNARVFLMTLDADAHPAQTFEASVDLLPQDLSDSDVSPLPGPVGGLVLRQADHSEALRWDETHRLVDRLPADPNPETPDIIAGPLAAQLDHLLEPRLALAAAGAPVHFRNLLRIPGAEPLAHLGDAIAAINARNWAAADLSLEKSLAYNAEDVLAWWLKAAVRRNGGLDQAEGRTERAEIMNAHYLSPLEPILRAESFLAAPANPHPDPSPLLKPLTDDPDLAIDCAARLLEAGLHEDLARFTDEALRHRESPGLRYLLAYQLLRQTRMEATAAEHVAAAAKIPLEPPFPWRPVEREAIRELHRRFPQDQRLATLTQILAQTPQT